MMTGGFFGHFVHLLFPGTTASSGAYTLVGMGAVVAAATHAPITAILIIFEMTNDYKIILPLMISTIIATLLSTKIQKEPIYTIKLVRRGIDIFRGRDINILHAIPVRAAMIESYQTVPVDMPLRKIIPKMLDSPEPEFFVVSNGGDYVGVLTLDHIRQTLQDEEYLGDLVIAQDLVRDDFPTIPENETLDNAMRLMAQHDTEFLPVVDPRNPRKIRGKLTWKRVVECYNHEIARQDVTTELAHSVKFLDHAKTLELVNGYSLAEIPCPGSFAGKTIKELDLRARYNVQVIMIKRKGSRQRETSVVPNPAEPLRADDTLVVVGPARQVERLRNL